MNKENFLLKNFMLSRKKEIIFSVICLVLFIGLIVYFVSRPYNYSKLEESSLTKVEENYESYSTTKSKYKIKCISGNEYELDRFLVEYEIIESFNNNDKLVLHIYNKDIIELEINDNVILNLESSNQKYYENFKTLLITSITFSLVIVAISIKMRSNNSKKNVKEELNQNLYLEIQDSIHEENGILKCNLLKYYDDDENIYTFYKAMLDYIDEDKIYFMSEDDNGAEIGYIFYKLGLKLYAFDDWRDNKEPYEINGELVEWYYPDVKVTDEAKEKFFLALEEFEDNHKDLIKIIK